MPLRRGFHLLTVLACLAGPGCVRFDRELVNSKQGRTADRHPAEDELTDLQRELSLYSD
ncbi:MAG: hypothetical protein LC745_08940 [Planctomycetia bacterium]|nr:hypothetical protein [Planctomycetia bacterium]